MDKLILKFKDRIIKEFEATGDLIRIGRDADNEIVIDNAAISRHHVKIERTGGRYTVSDLNSTNGTFLNKKRIKQRMKLIDGDIIIVGKHEIVFESEYKEEMNVPDLGGTIILDTQQQKELLGRQQKSPITTFVEEKKAKLIVFQSGEKKEYKLTKEVTVIGKALTSDVVLKGFLIPQTVATIKKEGSSFYITGYGGWIKVSINGRLAGKHWKLYPNDTIEVRRVKIIFQNK